MKKMKFTVLLLCGALLLGSCGTMNNKAKGGIIGGGSGAAAGAIIGGLIGKGKGAAIGAAVGAAVGTGAGVAIGHKMDKKAAEAAKIEGAQVEQVTDANGLPAVKVSFAAGILFGFNSAALSNEAKASLRELAQILKDCGVSPAQFKKVEGVGYNEYDESLSADQNRRVEVYMYASEQMIKNAEAAN